MNTKKCPVCDWDINDGGIKVTVGGKEIVESLGAGPLQELPAAEPYPPLEHRQRRAGGNERPHNRVGRSAGAGADDHGRGGRIAGTGRVQDQGRYRARRRPDGCMRGCRNGRPSADDADRRRHNITRSASIKHDAGNRFGAEHRGK